MQGDRTDLDGGVWVCGWIVERVGLSGREWNRRVYVMMRAHDRSVGDLVRRQGQQVLDWQSGCSGGGKKIRSGNWLLSKECS
jgi:hypothetical protein